jgi:hypothetical protein
MSKAKAICSAMRGHPQRGLRCFISITARTKSALGLFGPGFPDLRPLRMVGHVTSNGTRRNLNSDLHKSSFAIRSTPHLGLFEAMSTINSRTSVGTGGRRLDRGFHFQKSRNLSGPTHQRARFNNRQDRGPIEKSRQFSQCETDRIDGATGLLFLST